MGNLITVKNVSKTYKTDSAKKFKAVDNLSFNVKEASCFGFLGPNGAGKTTMMKMIYSRLERNFEPNSIIDVFGFDPAKNPLKVKFASGVVPQEDNLDVDINVFQNLLIYSKFYGMPKRDAKTRIDELLEFMDLSEKSKAEVRALSGGMRRRLVIARALLHKPRLLILDEPTTWNKLRELKENGMTILLTTHYMEEAYQICDNIIIMDEGVKIIEGPPKVLLRNNLEKYVLELTKFEKGLLTKLDIDKKVIRKDYFHEPLHLYSDDFTALRKVADVLDNKEHNLRQTNLEDLFMKLTGRTLNEFQ